MKINNFSHGVNDSVEPQILTEVFGCAILDARNYELSDGIRLEKLKSADQYDSSLDIIIEDISATYFWIWFPVKHPSILYASEKFMFVFYGNQTLWLVYKNVSNKWQKIQIDVATYNSVSDGNMSAYVGNDEIIFADFVNIPHVIRVTKDGDIVSGSSGNPAPLSIPTVSGAGADNKWTATDDDSGASTGMTIPRGSIVQYCYTQVTKALDESNPSPVVSYSNLQYQYPDIELGAGFKWWWKQAKLSSGIAINPTVDDWLKDELKYFRIYRRDCLYTENAGEIGAFKFVDQIPIENKTEEGNDHIDIEPTGFTNLSYENDLPPIAKYVTELGGIKFAANLKTQLRFPFVFDEYSEIEITNKNSVSYAEGVFCIVLTNDDFGDNYNVGDLFNDTDWDNNKHKIRLFDQDLTTPLRVVVDFSSGLIYFKLPLIQLKELRTLYFVYGGTGVADYSPWQNASYGQFMRIHNDTDWIQQKTFLPNRVRNQNVLICCSNEYYTSTTYRNRADGSYHGTLYEDAIWHPVSDNFPFMRVGDYVKQLHPYSRVVSMGNSEPLSGVNFGNIYQDDLKNISIFTELSFNSSLFVETPTITAGGEYYAYYLYSIFNNMCETGSGSDSRHYGFSLAFADLETNMWSSHKKGILLLWGDGDTAGGHNTRLIDERIIFWDLDSELAGSELKYWAIYMTIDASGNALLTVIDKDSGIVVRGIAPDYGSINFNDYETHEEMEAHIGSAEAYWQYYDESDDATRVYNYAIPYARYSQLLYSHGILMDHDHAEYLMNFMPYFSDAHIGWNGLLNDRVVITPKGELAAEENGGTLKWSDAYGMNFPDLYEKKFPEEINGLLGIKGGLELQYQNTLLIFSRNYLWRFILSGEPSDWRTSTSNLIKAFTNYGLKAPRSLGELEDMAFWVSEVGAMLFDNKKPIPISDKIIDSFPIKESLLGFPVPTKRQYWFHDAETTVTWIYHLGSKAWTSAFGFNISWNQIISLGDDDDNVNLFLTSVGAVNEYPGSDYLDTVGRIQIRKYFDKSPYYWRFKMDFEKSGATTLPVVTTIVNRDNSGMVTGHNISRMTNKGLENGTWGEYIDFIITNPDKLKSIHIDTIRR